jgi:hypothetical protein
MNLGLHYPHFAAKRGGSGYRFVRRGGDPALWYRYSIGGEDLLGLVFVQIHQRLLVTT